MKEDERFSKNCTEEGKVNQISKEMERSARKNAVSFTRIVMNALNPEEED